MSQNNQFIEPMRVQKWLAEMGYSTRRGAERLIREGLVTVDGKQAHLGMKITSQAQNIEVHENRLVGTPPPKVYWLFNKPDFSLVSHTREKDMKTIYDLPALKKVPFPVFSVGRLDYRTMGLLFLSNDGQLVHRLMHPKFKVPRYYQVLVNGKLQKEHFQRVKNGLKLDDGVVRNLGLEPIGGTNLGRSRGSWYLVTAREGRNRLVRRVFENLGFKVVTLIRVGFGEVALPTNLKPGCYSQLSAAEVRYLKRIVKL